MRYGSTPTGRQLHLENRKQSTVCWRRLCKYTGTTGLWCVIVTSWSPRSLTFLICWFVVGDWQQEWLIRYSELSENFYGFEKILFVRPIQKHRVQEPTTTPQRDTLTRLCIIFIKTINLPKCRQRLDGRDGSSIICMNVVLFGCAHTQQKCQRWRRRRLVRKYVTLSRHRVVLDCPAVHNLLNAQVGNDEYSYNQLRERFGIVDLYPKSMTVLFQRSKNPLLNRSCCSLSCTNTCKHTFILIRGSEVLHTNINITTAINIFIARTSWWSLMGSVCHYYRLRAGRARDHQADWRPRQGSVPE